MKTIAQFIEENKLTMTVESVARNPDMAEHMPRNFFCTIGRTTNPGGPTFKLHFSQGAAHIENPKLADVLDCLASDASSIASATGFEDWARDLGYDPDSRNAEKIYNKVLAQKTKLEAFLGFSAFSDLLYSTERE